MFRSTTIIRELQCPYQSHYYLKTLVFMYAYIQLWLNNSDFGKDILTP